MPNKLGYNKPPEPKFIREMKAKLGYREPENVLEDKLRGDAGDFDDREDRDDEAPTIVVMKDGDLTAEEAKDEETLQQKLEEEKKVAEGKIAFKKPTKREKDDKDAVDKDEPKKKKDKSEVKKVKQKSLLSFDDEEEEEY